MNGFKHVLSSILLTFSLVSVAQEKKELSLVFAGDIMGHDTQIESALAMGDGSYDYSSCFKYIEPFIQDADIAIGNLEVTLAGPPFKGYPAFSSPDELAVQLKNSGFDILVNANNHALDRRKPGLERTINVLDSLGLVQTGVFKSELDRLERYPLVVEKNGIRLAILNYTYGTNGIRASVPNIINYTDTTTILKDLNKALTAEPDFIIAMMHWGLEYERQENQQQKELAKFLFTHGTDAIIGSHPHVVQPIRMYPEEKLVVFSMGNMISNQRQRYTDGGILIRMILEKSDSTRIIDHSYLPVWVHKYEAQKGTAFSLVPASIDSTSYDQFEITGSNREAIKTFLEDTRTNLPGIKESGIGWLFE